MKKHIYIENIKENKLYALKVYTAIIYTLDSVWQYTFKIDVYPERFRIIHCTF